MNMKLALVAAANRQLAAKGTTHMPMASTAPPPIERLRAVDYSDLDARLTEAETAMAGRAVLREASLDRAEYQAHTERKLRLVPGSIHRQANADRKVAKTADIVAKAFDGVLPSVLRALRMGGLSDLQIAQIVIDQRVTA